MPILIDSRAVSAEISLIHLLTEAGTMFKRMLLLGPAVLVAAACSIDRAHPTDASVAANTSVAFSAVKFWDAGATVSWNQFATDLAQAGQRPGSTRFACTRISRSLSSALPRRHRPPRARIHRSPRPLVALRSPC